MLVDIEIKNAKEIKEGSILFCKNGKSFEAVDVKEILKPLENENLELKKRMFNLEKDMERQRKDFDKRIRGFVSAFTKGGMANEK